MEDSVKIASKRKSKHRSISDLTSEELQELKKLNLYVCATVPPPRQKSAYSNLAPYDEVRARYEELHYKAKSMRSDWLAAHRGTLKEARTLAT